MRTNKVNKVWTKSPQEMLDYIIQIDKEMGNLRLSSYIGKDIAYVRKVYEEYVGLESLTEQEQIENGYYKLEII
tara:strand:- start:411 stop:632 length:222 start_codon:yes stop_codon:yes gene_type:complete